MPARDCNVGAMQRSVAFYEREAWGAATAAGWRPRATQVLVVALDSAALGRRLLDNRDLAIRVFPAKVAQVAAWLRDPEAPQPRGWAIGMCDPASRSTDWLVPTPLVSRRRLTYAGYAEAAQRLRRRQ